MNALAMLLTNPTLLEMVSSDYVKTISKEEEDALVLDGALEDAVEGYFVQHQDKYMGYLNA